MNTTDTKVLLQLATALSPRVKEIVADVLKTHIQRNDVVYATLLAIVSGRLAFILGTPGIDKTGTIKALLRRILGATFQEELMPTLASGAQLVVEGTSLRETPDGSGGKLISTVDQLGGVAKKKMFFADEIWKTPDHILKVFFDLFNLDDVRWDGQVLKNELWTIISASNELPEEGSNLEALWSRITIRLLAKSLDSAGKKALVKSRLDRYRNKAAGKATTTATLTLEEVELLRQARPFVEVPDSIVDTVLEIFQTLLNDTNQDFQWLWDDDRRFGRIFDVLQANALLDGRDTVNASDLSVLEWLLWDTPEQIPVVKAAIAPYCRTPFMDAQEQVDALLTPGGTVELVRNGDRVKGVQAITQCEATFTELNRLKNETGDTQMKAKIQTLIDQVNEVKAEVIAVVTGAKRS